MRAQSIKDVLLKVWGLALAGLLGVTNVAYCATSASDSVHQARELMTKPAADLDLAQAKLTIDRLIDPSIDAAPILRQLDELTAIVRSGFPPNAGNRQKLEAAGLSIPARPVECRSTVYL